MPNKKFTIWYLINFSNNLQYHTEIHKLRTEQS